MRLKNIVRSAMTGGASLALALGLASCSRDYTVAWVYSVSASNGTISAYGVDFETGILNQISGSPFATSFTNPITVVAAPNNKFIYEIGGSQNAQVAEYAVGTDGKIYGEHTYNLTGTYPTSATVDTTGTYLYVTYTYQMGFSPASPGPGGVTIFPISQTDNSLGTPSNLNVGNNPVGVAFAPPASGTGTAANTVHGYVLDQEVTAARPTILGFTQNASTGALTPLPGTSLTTFQGYSAGVTPSAIRVDGTARFVYVTDEVANQIYGYGINSATGDLTALSGSPYGTGQPDPRSELEVRLHSQLQLWQRERLRHQPGDWRSIHDRRQHLSGQRRHQLRDD